MNKPDGYLVIWVDLSCARALLWGSPHQVGLLSSPQPVRPVVRDTCAVSLFISVGWAAVKKAALGAPPAPPPAGSDLFEAGGSPGAWQTWL